MKIKTFKTLNVMMRQVVKLIILSMVLISSRLKMGELLKRTNNKYRCTSTVIQQMRVCIYRPFPRNSY